MMLRPSSAPHHRRMDRRHQHLHTADDPEGAECVGHTSSSSSTSPSPLLPPPPSSSSSIAAAVAPADTLGDGEDEHSRVVHMLGGWEGFWSKDEVSLEGWGRGGAGGGDFGGISIREVSTAAAETHIKAVMTLPVWRGGGGVGGARWGQKTSTDSCGLRKHSLGSRFTNKPGRQEYTRLSVSLSGPFLDSLGTTG